MLRTFHVRNKAEYKPGQRVSVYSTMPEHRSKETYEIVKLVYYSKANEIGEYQVKPVSVGKDPGNLTDGHGHASKGLR